MSDEELDRDWKPSNRPQSTMARSFSLALDDLFKIDNSIADLDAAVSEKKMKVTSQTSELEALEARLRATEERLKAAASGETSPTSRRSGGSSPRTRAPLGDTFSHAQREREQPTSPLSESTRAPSRPQTANRPKTRDGRPVTGRRPTESHSQAPPMPGALPPTPGASEGESESLSESEPEYVLVERQRMNPSADLNPVAEDDGDDVPPPPPAKDNQ